MTVQYFILDNTHGNYAAQVSHLASFDAANFNFTPTQTNRALNGNSTLRIVKSDVTATDINATTDLSALALTSAVYGSANVHVPSSACRGRFTSLGEFRALGGFHLLAESERASPRYLSGRNIYYIGASSLGNADGSTPFDTVDPVTYKTNVSTHWDGDGLHVCIGPMAGTWTVGGDPRSRLPGMSNNVEFRMDYVPNPGIVYTGVINNVSFNNTWSQPNAGSFPNLWEANFDVGNPGNDMWLYPPDATLSVSALYQNNTFYIASSKSHVETTSMAIYASSKNIRVHMPNSDNPTSKIVQANNQGWTFLADTATTGTQFEDIYLTNCQFVGRSASLSQGACGSTQKIPKAIIRGGRYLQGVSWKPTGDFIDGTEFSYSTDGTIVFDTSDRPDPDTDTYIVNVVSAHGSDATEWAKMSRFVHIDSASEGIYQFSGPVSGHGLTIKGLLTTHIGTRHPVMINKRKFDGYTDGDSHALGAQGASRWNVSYLYVRKAGGAVNLYANGDATNTQNQQNNTFSDFIIVDSHNSATGAGTFGIDINGNGNWAARRANGTGVVSGNSFTRFHIENMQTSYGGSPPIDGGAFHLYCYEQMDISNGTIRACDHCFVGGNTVTLNGSFAAASGSRTSPQFNVSGVSMETPDFYFVNHRFLNWTATGSGQNPGFYIFNDNKYVYPVGGSVDSNTYWRWVSTDQTFADWQANSKGSPPGDRVSVYDPDSTTEVET